jgi:hypothetical protein
MDRDTAVRMAQQAVRTKNRRLVEAVLRIRAERERNPAPVKPTKANVRPGAWTT